MTDTEADAICARELSNALERIRAVGPDRVVIDFRGVALPADDAAQAGMLPDVVFVRNDGWSLGAPRQFEPALRRAWRVWDRYWIARYDLATDSLERLNDPIPY